MNYVVRSCSVPHGGCRAHGGHEAPRLLPSSGSQSGGDKPPKSWSLGHKEEC